jgi:hypothetical protein
MVVGREVQSELEDLCLLMRPRESADLARGGEAASELVCGGVEVEPQQR